jgi:protein involved in polysaccharide export with SLBB domain
VGTQLTLCAFKELFLDSPLKLALTEKSSLFTLGLIFFHLVYLLFYHHYMFSRIFLFITCIFLLSSCSTSQPKLSLEENAAYRPKAGDTLLLKVRGDERYSDELFVRKDQTIKLRNEKLVSVKDQPLSEIQENVSKNLSTPEQNNRAKLSLLVKGPISYKMKGKFVNGGTKTSERQITLLEAINDAGNFEQSADESKIELIRKTTAGKLIIQLDYNRLLQGEDPNPILKNGDIVSVN